MLATAPRLGEKISFTEFALTHNKLKVSALTISLASTLVNFVGVTTKSAKLQDIGSTLIHGSFALLVRSKMSNPTPGITSSSSSSSALSSETSKTIIDYSYQGLLVTTAFDILVAAGLLASPLPGIMAICFGAGSLAARQFYGASHMPETDGLKNLIKQTIKASSGLTIVGCSAGFLEALTSFIETDAAKSISPTLLVSFTLLLSNDILFELNKLLSREPAERNYTAFIQFCGASLAIFSGLLLNICESYGLVPVGSSNIGVSLAANLLMAAEICADYHEYQKFTTDSVLVDLEAGGSAASDHTGTTLLLREVSLKDYPRKPVAARAEPFHVAQTTLAPETIPTIQRSIKQAQLLRSAARIASGVSHEPDA